ncbi:OsmC family protein [Roseateles sp. BYS87W]|uniref:OsmC family protein n=1 Tax=Pelomonas baiyunensis TaxID=3299026 RepID=A0ABW7GYJ8_9BURK
MDHPTATLTQRQNYLFEHRHGARDAVLLADEPPPLGTGQGPDPVELLASAVGHCLSASLWFACQKYKDDPSPLRTEVQATVGRNDRGRNRVQALAVDLHLGQPAADLAHLQRVLDTFEDFCTVTQSIAAAIPVTLRVLDSTGAVVKG